MGGPGKQIEELLGTSNDSLRWRIKSYHPFNNFLIYNKVSKYSERTGCIIDVLEKDTLPEYKPNSRKYKTPSCKHKSIDEEHLLDNNCKVPLRNVREVHLIVIVQLLSHVWLFLTPCTAARLASLSLTISQSLLWFMPMYLQANKWACRSFMDVGISPRTHGSEIKGSFLLVTRAR